MRRLPPMRSGSLPPTSVPRAAHPRRPRRHRGAGHSDPIPAELAPYLDLLAVPAGADTGASPRSRRATSDHVAGGHRQEPGAERTRRSGRARQPARDAGHRVVLHAWLSSEALDAAIRSLAPLAALMAGEVSALDPGAAALSLTIEGRDVTASVRHRLLFDERTFATYLVYWSDASAEPLQAALTLPVEGVPAVYQLSSGTRLQAAGYSRDQQTGQVRVSVPRRGARSSSTSTRGRPRCSWTAATCRRSGRFRWTRSSRAISSSSARRTRWSHSYIASARMSQHFRPTMTDPGYDVVTENRYFVADDGIEWEELSFSVNGSKWGAIGRRSRCCSRKRCCRCRCSCVSTTTIAIAWQGPSASAATTATSSASIRRRATPRSIEAPSGLIARRSRESRCRPCRRGCRHRSSRTKRFRPTSRRASSATGPSFCSPAWTRGRSS